MRTWVTVFAAVVLAGDIPWAGGQAIGPGSVTVRLQPVVTIPSADGAPQDLVSANDGTGRLFVATRNGRIRVIDPGGTLNATTYLNLNTAIGGVLNTAGEGGFSGLAFHPNFAAASTVPGSGRFYTFTTENFSAANGSDFSQDEMLPIGGATPNNQIVIREWTASTPTAPTANTSLNVLMRINHPQANHQGGALKFGPDGNLYMGVGDGGGSNDFFTSAGSTTDGHNSSIGNAQDLTVAMGKVLRINPLGTNSVNGNYGVPTDNPFFSSTSAVKEIFAYGLRNPYRFSFDSRPGGTNNLFVADVGQGQREEVDVITPGGNYGWVFREGTRDNTASSGRTLPTGFTSLSPIAEYTHSDGISIIGGFVYRGSAIPALQGKYVFGDLQGPGGVARLFYMNATGGTINELQYDSSGGGITPSGQIFGFGEDSSGELYGLFGNGQVVKIVPEPRSVGLLVAMLAPRILARRRRAQSAPT
jgi:glucose/arabinose dehydrogenase